MSESRTDSPSAAIAARAVAGPLRFRFRPRYRGLVALAAAVAAGLLVARFAIPLAGTSGTFAVACGVAGLALAGLYFASPAWRLEVVIDGDGLEVRSRTERRFRLAWDEIARVVASPATKTCYVDGGSPARSLIVPGRGASAPYDIEDKPALYDAILARAPAAAIAEVELLETANRELSSDDGDDEGARDDGDDGDGGDDDDGDGGDDGDARGEIDAAAPVGKAHDAS